MTATAMVGGTGNNQLNTAMEKTAAVATATETAMAIKTATVTATTKPPIPTMVN
jgi:hypothetical protein